MMRKYTASTYTVLFSKNTKKYMCLRSTCTWKSACTFWVFSWWKPFKYILLISYYIILKFWIFRNQNFSWSDCGRLHLGCRRHAKWSDLGNFEKVHAQVHGMYCTFRKIQIHVLYCTVLFSHAAALIITMLACFFVPPWACPPWKFRAELVSCPPPQKILRRWLADPLVHPPKNKWVSQQGVHLGLVTTYFGRITNRIGWSPENKMILS